MSTIILKPKKEKSIRRRHPWIFSGAIAKRKGNPQLGATVDVLDHSGNHLGKGAYSPDSQIAVRMWHFGSTSIDKDWFRSQLEHAIQLREHLRTRSDCNAYRIIHGESDGFPGLIVDRYDEWIVCQFLSAGVEIHKHMIVSLLQEAFEPKGIYERSDASIREKEGLYPITGVLAGEEPPERVEIQEGLCRFWVDIRNGHKTGFYLDQRINRSEVTRWSQDRRVLNCFSYTGGFGIAAAQGGAAHTTHIDTSAHALALAQAHIELNELSPEKNALVEGDVFQVLRQYRKEKRTFDLIVMDPPKFIDSKRNLDRGCRGYKDINMLAFQLLEPGGLLFTYSCSGLMPTPLFQKVVADAALDAHKGARILRRLGQAMDHPIRTSFPEGEYLKGLLCQVD